MRTTPFCAGCADLWGEPDVYGSPRFPATPAAGDGQVLMGQWTRARRLIPPPKVMPRRLDQTYTGGAGKAARIFTPQWAPRDFRNEGFGALW